MSIVNNIKFPELLVYILVQKKLQTCGNPKIFNSSVLALVHCTIMRTFKGTINLKSISHGQYLEFKRQHN